MKFEYVFVLFFIGMLITVLYLLSKKGWADLTAKYQSDEPFIGTRVGLISASINNVYYKNSLVLRYNGDGIYLRPIFPFRLFHKPVLIPWKEIKEVRTKKYFFSTYKQLIVGNPFVAIIEMPNWAFLKIEHNFDRRSTTGIS